MLPCLLKLRPLTLLAAPFALGVGVLAAADASAPKSPLPAERRELRVLSGPERELLTVIEARVAGDGKMELEQVTFLGVETGPVAGALAAQLGLAEGTGLVVNHIVPQSAAAGVLAVHDILVKLDDQILIETRQLAVLIRGKKAGDEVTFTYLRGGKSATAKVKLGQREMPKTAAWSEGGAKTFNFVGVPASEDGRPNSAADRGEVDRVLGLLKRSHAAGTVREEIARGEGPGFRVIAINTGNSTLSFNDDQGSLELTVRDGAKSVVAKDRDGKVVFSGPATGEAERKAMPAEVRARLEKVEGMREMSFRTDGEFKGVQNRTIRPRGISLPVEKSLPAAAGSRSWPPRVL